MNDDELKKLWQQQPLREPAVSAEQLVSAMQNRTTLLRRCLDSRDLRELIACAVVTIIFGVFYFTVSHTLTSRVGDLIIIGSSIFIAWKLVYARRSTPPAPAGATIVESLQAELKAVRAQSQLLGSIFWWYLLPLAIGMLVCTWGNFGGGMSNLVENLIYTVFVIALFVFIYRLNQRARTQQLLPFEVQLQSLIRFAETGEPLEETQIANLRPILLSTRAADQVKPAEFKVAFWQIALFAEIGFIGIWFFLMLGLAEGDRNWWTEEHTREIIVQTVSVETNRYSIVARKVVDRFNADEYAGVRKLYNSAMKKALPPNEIYEFYARLAPFGRIETIERSAGNGYRGWTAFRLHCERGELIMSLALDEDDKIAGIYFQPVPRPSASIGLVFRRLFSWPHLLLIVPFFLAGLLYSWLLQKWTERAVGISTLGIHLYKGMNRILWDEIKEVQPFKLLHIRSLWLIRESGEKTMMPWTSLERHSDLKAAVENAAPENHPIRKHLALLKRL